MPQPAHYKRVFEAILGQFRTEPVPDAELADKIVAALDMADILMSTDSRASQAQAQRGVLIQTPAANRVYPDVDLSRGQVIGAARIVEEAPPVAVVRNQDAPPSAESEEEIERKKAALHNELLTTLPTSILVNLPELGRDIRLLRFIKPSPPMMNFIRVLYAQYAEEEDGPQVQLSVSQPVDADVIKKDIVEQAAMRYRRARQKIEPRTPPPTGFPTEEEMARAIAVNPTLRTDDKASPEEMADWDRSPRLT